MNIIVFYVHIQKLYIIYTVLYRYENIKIVVINVWRFIENFKIFFDVLRALVKRDKHPFLLVSFSTDSLMNFFVQIFHAALIISNFFKNPLSFAFTSRLSYFGTLKYKIFYAIGYSELWMSRSCRKPVISSFKVVILFQRHMTVNCLCFLLCSILDSFIYCSHKQIGCLDLLRVTVLEFSTQISKPKDNNIKAWNVRKVTQLWHDYALTFHRNHRNLISSLFFAKRREKLRSLWS